MGTGGTTLGWRIIRACLLLRFLLLLLLVPLHPLQLHDARPSIKLSIVVLGTVDTTCCHMSTTLCAIDPSIARLQKQVAETSAALRCMLCPRIASRGELTCLAMHVHIRRPHAQPTAQPRRRRGIWRGKDDLHHVFGMGRRPISALRVIGAAMSRARRRG